MTATVKEKKPKAVQVAFYLTPVQFDWLKAKSVETGASMNWMIRTALFEKVKMPKRIQESKP